MGTENEPLCKRLNGSLSFIASSVESMPSSVSLFVYQLHSITMKASTHYRAANLNILRNDNDQCVYVHLVSKGRE